jgi:uncharacterized membrane protein YciS (DUF1049 family)
LIVGFLMSLVIYVMIYDRIKNMLAAEKEAKRRKLARKKANETTVIEEIVNDWDYLFEPSNKKGRK